MSIRVQAIVAVTIDGFIGHSLPERLLLSSEDDINDVMKLRANCDAILVGAGTIRHDNSTLVTRDPELIKHRLDQNKCQDPIKVTLTKKGNIPLSSNFIKVGDCEKIVYTSNLINQKNENELSKVVTLKKFESERVTAKQIVTDLSKRGVRNMIVEGGTQILTMFLEENLINDLRLSIAPFLVGDGSSPRFTNSRRFTFNKNNRMKLVSVKSLGDMAVMQYQLKDFEIKR
ncbi:dihydrofolate reductase family protein [Fulvivirgaceae bacterium BMA10]|uniref:Dihydrofolate reductase family protein n=1 Tax=Splendidivirga corallicola TaxID=3051826 RepID=A0ABT8KXG1_9BACT|nr:dihydrofolate reductase family protein [Fulvivirgaceae bacterium BMA10]